MTTVTSREQKQRVQVFFDQAESWQGKLYTDQSERFNRAMVRRKRYAVQMLHRLNGVKTGVALDIGCGCGVYLEELMNIGCDARGLEFSKDMLQVCRMRLHRNGLKSQGRLICGDIERIPCGSEEFDLVLCIGVLGYLLSDHAALNELYRIVKPGGFLLVALQNMMSLSNLDYVLRARLRSFLRPQTLPALTETPPGVSMTIPWILQHADYRYKAYHPWRFERLMTSLGFRLVDAMTFGYEFRLLRRLRIIPESVLNAVEISLERLFHAIHVPYFSYSGDFYTAIFERLRGDHPCEVIR